MSKQVTRVKGLQRVFAVATSTAIAATASSRWASSPVVSARKRVTRLCTVCILSYTALTVHSATTVMVPVPSGSTAFITVHSLVILFPSFDFIAAIISIVRR